MSLEATAQAKGRALQIVRNDPRQALQAPAVRIGFDDNRSLGPRETGGMLALPVFQELMLGVYRDRIVGAAPAFPARMAERITAALLPPNPPPATDVARDAVAYVFGARHRRTSPAETDWLAPPFPKSGDQKPCIYSANGLNDTISVRCFPPRW